MERKRSIRCMWCGSIDTKKHGKIKKPYLEIMYGKKHLKEMAEVKKVFDKPCVLGLDNIFSKDLLK